MVKLYKFNKAKGTWIFTDYGVKSKVREYTAMGYICIYI